MSDFIGGLAILAGVLAIVSVPIAWCIHIVWWIKLMMNEEMDTIGEGVLAILGTIIPPIGIVHGYILWF